MPPLAYAVRLVDGKQAYLHARKRAHERRRPETFGRDVGQLQLAVFKALQYGALLVPRLRTVYHGRGVAARDKRVNLVFHQRDKRGYHERNAVLEHGGQLVAEAFAGRPWA